MVNLHPEKELGSTRVLFPNEAVDFLRFSPAETKLRFAEKLAGKIDLSLARSSLAGPDGLALPPLAPLHAYFFEITSPND